MDEADWTVLYFNGLKIKKVAGEKKYSPATLSLMNRVHFFIQLFPWYIQYVNVQFKYQFMLSTIIIIIIITIIDKRIIIMYNTDIQETKC